MDALPVIRSPYEAGYEDGSEAAALGQPADCSPLADLRYRQGYEHGHADTVQARAEAGL